MNYGEFESSKGEGFYRIFYIISAVRITTTTSADGVHACNICTKNSSFLRTGQYGFQAPVKARLFVPMQRVHNTHSAVRTMRDGCLSRGKIVRLFALTTKCRDRAWVGLNLYFSL
jgi:hypothetical protein